MQNVQKLLILAVLASSVASILKKINRYKIINLNYTIQASRSSALSPLLSAQKMSASSRWLYNGSVIAHTHDWLWFTFYSGYTATITPAMRQEDAAA